MSNKDIITVNLKIYWIRHGFSCANYLYNNYSIVKGIKDKSKLAPDAKLTDITLNKICEMKNTLNNDYFCNILKSDFILCSELTRAIETAMMLFGTFKKTIYVVPYIGELVDTSGLGKTDNKPSDRQTKLNNIKNIINFHNINADKCGGKFNSIVSLDIIDDKKTTPHFGNFLREVIPYLITHDKKKQITNNTLNFTLTLVSHSKFIQEKTQLHPQNLEIILQYINAKYNVENTKYAYKSGSLTFSPFVDNLYINILNKHYFLNKIKLNKYGAVKYKETNYGIIHNNMIKPTNDLQRCDYKI